MLSTRKRSDMENQEPDVDTRPLAESRGRAAPLFYFSHVSPSAEGEDGPRPDDGLFRTFFEDLSSTVAQQVPHLGAETVGYLADEKSADGRRARALATCQVFVPLLSPLYFRNQRCGRDWQAFRSRVPAAERATRFAPVIWAPVKEIDIPRGLDDAVIGPNREDRPDAVNGLYSLLNDGDQEQYTDVVRDITSTIVAALHATPLRAARPTDLSKLRSAFESAPHLSALRILILAPTSGRVSSASRAPGAAYGTSQLDWAPYGASWGRSLAADVEDIATRQGYRPEIAGFDETTLADLRTGRLSAAPTILLIDNWALLDEASRALVRGYLAMDFPWQLFMVVRETWEPETELRVEALRNAVNDTLEEPLAHMRIDVRHAASGEGSRTRFPLDFALIAQVAAGRFRKKR